MSTGDSYSQIPGGSGDKIHDEDIGGGIKIATSKLHLGALGIDSGPVSVANPLPVDGSHVTQPISNTFLDAGLSTLATENTLESVGGSLGAQLAAVLAALPAALGGGGGLKIDGSGTPLQIAGAVTTSGTATVSGTVAVSSLPAITGAVTTSGTATVSGTVSLGAGSAAIGSLTAGTAVIGHVVTDAGSTTAVTALPAIPAGSNAIGSVTVTSAPTTAVTIAALPALTTGSATIGAVTAPGAAALALDATLSARLLLGQQTSANSRSVIHPSDASLRQVDCTPTGNLWTTTIGKVVPTSQTAAGINLIAATAGTYLRQFTITNPVGAATVFFFVYHAAAGPTWSTSSGPSIADNTLIACGSVAAGAAANVLADEPGALLVPSGVTLVVSTTSGALANSFTAPVTKLWVTYRSGT